MEFIGTIFLAGLVALLLLTAFTFGVWLLLVLICTAAVMGVLVVAQDAWRRWRFVKSAGQPPTSPSAPRVIEGEYEDVSHKE